MTVWKPDCGPVVTRERPPSRLVGQGSHALGRAARFVSPPRARGQRKTNAPKNKTDRPCTGFFVCAFLCFPRPWIANSAKAHPLVPTQVVLALVLALAGVRYGVSAMERGWKKEREERARQQRLNNLGPRLTLDLRSGGEGTLKEQFERSEFEIITSGGFGTVRAQVPSRIQWKCLGMFFPGCTRKTRGKFQPI